MQVTYQVEFALSLTWTTFFGLGSRVVARLGAGPTRPRRPSRAHTTRGVTSLMGAPRFPSPTPNVQGRYRLRGVRQLPTTIGRAGAVTLPTQLIVEATMNAVKRPRRLRHARRAGETRHTAERHRRGPVAPHRPWARTDPPSTRPSRHGAPSAAMYQRRVHQ